MKQFNYTIGRYWENDSGSIATYKVYTNDVFYGTLKEAKQTLKYIKKQSPDKGWRIFILSEHSK